MRCPCPLTHNALLRYLPLEQNRVTTVDQDEWTLNSDQTIFMMQCHSQIEVAFENEDIEFLHELANSSEFKSIFGDMSFDEAYDRYECMPEDGRAEA